MGCESLDGSSCGGWEIRVKLREMFMKCLEMRVGLSGMRMKMCGNACEVV